MKIIVDENMHDIDFLKELYRLPDPGPDGYACNTWIRGTWSPITSSRTSPRAIRAGCSP